MPIERVSTDRQGAQTSGQSFDAAISSSGRYVVFSSTGADLAGGQLGGGVGLYVKDMQTGEIERIDQSSAGVVSNGDATNAAISADGRYVTYSTTGSNLAGAGVDDNGRSDVAIFDRLTGETRLVSLSEDGTTASGSSYAAAISKSGRYVAYVSDANDVDADGLLDGQGNPLPDTNTAPGTSDVFIFDTQTGHTLRTSEPLVGADLSVNDAWSVSDFGYAAYSATHYLANGQSPRSYVYLDDHTGPAVSGSSSQKGLLWQSYDSQGAPTYRAALGMYGTYSNDGLFSIVGHTPSGEVRLDCNDLSVRSRSPEMVLAKNGRFVAYLSDFDVTAQAKTPGINLYVWNMDTGQVATLVVAPAGATLSNIQISANGRWITFDTDAQLTSDDTNGTADVYRVENPFGTIGGSGEVDLPSGTDWIMGTPEADELLGTYRKDKIDALEGNDTVAGRGGDDLIYGRDGDDQLVGGAGSDTLEGGAGADVIAGDHGDNAQLDGAADTITGGAGNDDLYGEAGDDHLSGDDGDDQLWGDQGDDYLDGGEGDDELFGGHGDDILSGGAGDDLLDGGTEAEGEAPDVDVAIYAGSASDYKIVDVFTQGGTDDQSAVLNLVNDDEDTVVNVERAQFEHLPENAVTVENPLVMLARAAKAAYDDTASLGQGWRALSALELGIRQKGENVDEGYGYSYRNGVYEGFSDSSLPGGLTTAGAHVYFGEVNDQNTLMIAFRGTDELSDAADYPDFAAHYEKFQPLIDAIVNYVNANGYTTDGQVIERVLVTGHSLGGSMAQMFMQDPRIAGDDRYRAVTFGSPGAGPSEPDPRMLHVEHSADLVPYAGDIARVLLKGVLGPDIWGDLMEEFQGNPTAYRTAGGVIRVSMQDGDDPRLQHGVDQYLATAQRLAAFDPAFDKLGFDGAPGTVFNVVAGGPGSETLEGANPFVPTVLRGLGYYDGSEVFFGGAGANIMTGGLGRDIFAGTLEDLANDRITDLGDGDRICIIGPDPGAGCTYEPLPNPYEGGYLHIGGIVIALAGWHPGTFSFVGTPDGYAMFEYNGLLGLIGGEDDDDFAGGDGDDVLSGGQGDDVLAGGAGDDRLIGGEGSDRLQGGGGNDQIYGGAEPAGLEADAGFAAAASAGAVTARADAAALAAPGDPEIDTVVYAGRRMDYKVTVNGDGSITVTDRRPGQPDGVDVLRDIERIEFTDLVYEVTPPTAAPVVDGAGGVTSFTESIGAAPSGMRLAPSLTVADADSTGLAWARVRIVSNHSPDEDVLTLSSKDGAGDITAAYDAATGVLTLTSASGQASTAEWQAALRAVTYNNTSDTPSTATRTIEIVVSDGAATSAPVTQDVTVTARNDAPDGTDASFNVAAGSAKVFGLADFGFRDPDGHALVAVRIVDPPEGGGLRLNGVAVTDGQLVSAADIAAGRLVYTPTAGAGATARFRFQVQDSGGVVDGASDVDPDPNTVTLVVTAAPPPPPPGPDPSPPAGGGANGTPGDDIVRLGHEGRTFAAGDGNDDVASGDGADWLHGNPGNDTLSAGGGADTVHGGRGDDRLLGGAGDDVLSGDLGDDQLDGGAGDDVILGWDGADALAGGDAADFLHGNAGVDTLDGGAGHDTLYGGQGHDVLSGGVGDDRLWGDRGDDTLSGGDGADVFHFSTGTGLDRVTDFDGAAGDRIRLQPGLAYAVRAEGDDTLITFEGGQVLLAGVSPATFASDWII